MPSAHREPFPGVEIFQRRLALSMTAASLTLVDSGTVLLDGSCVLQR